MIYSGSRSCFKFRIVPYLDPYPTGFGSVSGFTTLVTGTWHDEPSAPCRRVADTSRLRCGRLPSCWFLFLINFCGFPPVGYHCAIFFSMLRFLHGLMYYFLVCLTSCLKSSLLAASWPSVADKMPTKNKDFFLEIFWLLLLEVTFASFRLFISGDWSPKK